MVQHIQIDDLTPRVSYTVGSSPRSSFPFPRTFFADTDLVVSVDGTIKTRNVDYTVAGDTGFIGGYPSGTVTLLVAATNADVLIYRNVPYERNTDFPSSGPIQTTSLNTELDKFVAMVQQLDDRALMLTDGSEDIYDAQGRRLSGLADGTEADDAVTLDQVETLITDMAVSVSPPGSYPIATQNQAEEGTRNDVLMTPLRTREAFDAITEATTLPVLPTSKSGVVFAQIFESSMSPEDIAAVRANQSYQVIWGGRPPAPAGTYNSGYIPGQRDPDATHNIVLRSTTNLVTTPIWTGSSAEAVAWWEEHADWILYRTVTSPYELAYDFDHPGNQIVPVDTRNPDVRAYLYGIAKGTLDPGYAAIGLDNLTPVNLRGSGQKRGVLDETGQAMTVIYPDDPLDSSYVEDQIEFYRDMTARAHADGLLHFANLGRTYHPPITVTGNGSSGAFILTSLSSTAELAEGMDVSGTGVGEGAVVVSVDSGTQVTLSVALTGNISGGSIAFQMPSTLGTREGRDIYLRAAEAFDLILVERGGAITGSQTNPKYTGKDWELRHQSNRALAQLDVHVVTIDWGPTVNSYQYFSGDGAEDTFTVTGFKVIDPARMKVFVGTGLSASSDDWDGYTPVTVSWVGQSFTFAGPDIPPSADDNILVLIDNQSGLDTLIDAGDPTNDYAHGIAASWEAEISPGVVSPIAGVYEYAIGSWLLARGERSLWSFAPTNGALNSVVDGVYWDLIGARVEIGTYEGDPYFEGFLGIRRYSNGIVLVNPTEDKDQVFQLPPDISYTAMTGGTYEDSILVPAATAFVLVITN